MKSERIIVFTDGSSRGNPGPGGWGALLIEPSGKVAELGGREDHTTNNRMEMTAALEAILFVEKRKIAGDIEIHTDSAYLLQGVTTWIYGWQKNGWKTKTGDDVLNRDIWEGLAAAMFRNKGKRAIEFVKVAGHSGLFGNERVDQIATEFADNARPILFIGNLTQYETLLGGSVFAVDPNAEVTVKKPSKKKSSAAAYSYVSEVDGDVKTHATWAECEKRVKGKKARFKKVFSADEERSLTQEWSGSARTRKS